jgi:hypothetical protein
MTNIQQTANLSRALREVNELRVQTLTSGLRLVHLLRERAELDTKLHTLFQQLGDWQNNEQMLELAQQLLRICEGASDLYERLKNVSDSQKGNFGALREALERLAEATRETT